MKKLNFLLGIHNHQPVGNFDDVFLDCFQKSYLPFIEALERHPGIRISLHYSGPLLDWLAENKKWFFEKINNLVQRNQVELLSGGFYEPILSILPAKDALGQIRMMNDYIREKFSVEPEGMWLAERVWDPTLPETIKKAGIKYTILDDTHFYYAGLKKEEMSGYFLTEKNGDVVSVFPIDRFLRYAIPFREPEETINYFRGIYSQFGDTGITFADDGEKFGVWPGTHQWVFQEGWLEKFFCKLEENFGWIEMLTFSEYMKKYPPRKKIFLPSASYEEMMEWSLADTAMADYHAILEELEEEGLRDRYRPYLRGGIWDNFLVKYPEVNQMHKKMLYVSQKVGQNPLAIKELYKGQCNCPYWHGLFGGVYLNYLRHAIYYHLIAAENITDDIENNPGKIDCRVFDFDKDLQDEILVGNSKINACFKPDYGGALMELDYRPACFNLSNVFTRRHENYHQNVKVAEEHMDDEGDAPKSIHDLLRVKERGLSEKLFYDWYQRYSFLDHILGKEANPDNFQNSRYPEIGDFVNQPYRMERCENKKSGVEIVLRRDGGIYENGARKDFGITKTFLIKKGVSVIQTEYQLHNGDVENNNVWFGVEFNFTLLAGDNPERYYFIPGVNLSNNKLNSRGESYEVSSFGMIDDWNRFKLQISFDVPAVVWRFPIETISQSEDGFEKNYQSSSILAHWKINFQKKEIKKINIKLEVVEF